MENLMVPKTLLEWDIQSIITLLEKGYYESEFFDFKEMLPHSKDESGKARLRKICCAFANSYGGYIIFGISDDRTKHPIERLVGVSPTVEFPEHFGSFPAKCSPSIDWNFRNPPLQLENGKIIHVIEIPRSWYAPHAVGDSESGWGFFKRTNKGDEGMSYEEIRMSYLGYYEKRLKLNLLKSELQNIKNDYMGFIFTDGGTNTAYSYLKFDIAIIESVISETYTILAEHNELMNSLTNVRKLCKVFNNKIDIYHSTSSSPLIDRNQFESEHSKSVNESSKIILLCAEAALSDLGKIR